MKIKPVRRALISFVIFIALVITAASLWLFPPSAGVEKKPETAPMVNAQYLTHQTLSPIYKTVAYARAFTDAVISSEVAGSIINIPVNKGQKVAKGQLLIQLETHRFALQVESNQAQLDSLLIQRQQNSRSCQHKEALLEQAENSYELAARHLMRLEQLLAQKQSSAYEYDQAKDLALKSRAERDSRQFELDNCQLEDQRLHFEIDKTKAALDLAIKDRNDASITAPFTGVISEKLVSVGDVISTTTPLLRLHDPQSFKLEAMISNSQLETIGENKSIYACLNPDDNNKHKGCLSLGASGLIIDFVYPYTKSNRLSSAA
ncbi:MAG: HlyD family secretion protein [Francisellaceae bacterium]